MAGGMHGRGHAWQGVCVTGVHDKRGKNGRGLCMAEGACMARQMTNAADGTHPTGMHSCVKIILHNYILYVKDIRGKFEFFQHT